MSVFRRSFLGPFSTILVILHLLSPVFSDSLYTLDDPLWELDSGNFQRIVHGKNHAWIIEFYSSWCGHCIRFAPTWKEFARDIENWKNMIEIGVVNCAESENTNICREYGVSGYPTIKLFWTRLNGTQNGDKFEGSRTLPNIRHAIIDFLHSHENSTVPDFWPVLNEVRSHDVSSLWNDIPSSVNSVFIVVENPFSYVGREVILDFTIKRHITTRRVLTKNAPLLKHLLPDYNNVTLTLLRVSRDGTKEVLYTSPSDANSTVIRDEVYDIVVGGRRVKSIDEKPDGKEDGKVSTYQGVYMADIDNAIHYALRQEVGVKGIIAGEALSSLKAFLLALKKYFPGTLPVKGYLLRLSHWVSSRKGNLTGARFISKMDELQTDDEYLPPMREFVGCKGSQSKYRGYPCSLWTLFHTLTVQAYNIYDEDPMIIKEAPQKVLFDIRGYVKHFFTCEGCSSDFQELSANLEQETKSPKDTVMWLWQAHNKVNRKLSGDETEDPKHKKEQFPSEKSCGKCRVVPGSNGTDIQWDRYAVLRYVRHFYSKERIKPVGSILEASSDAGMENMRTSSASRIDREPWSNGNVQFLLQILNILPLLRQAPEM